MKFWRHRKAGPHRGPLAAPDAPAARRASAASAFVAMTVLRDAARGNLVALLAAEPPLPLPEAALWPARNPASDPPMDTAEATPIADLTRQVLADDAAFVAAFDPAAAAIRGVLWPDFLRQTFADTRLLQDLANLTRAHLARKVLFHPGPPPVPLFSPASLGVLTFLQEIQRDGLGQTLPLMESAILRLRGADMPRSDWDGWLLRQMQMTRPWTLPEDLAADPAVVWRAPDPLPPPIAPDRPAYWAACLDLTP